jgi:hypothetical protein
MCPAAVEGGGVAAVAAVRPRREKYYLRDGATVALYLVVHTPAEDQESERGVRSPTRLRELAEASTQSGEGPRWIKAWSPDLHDDRIFTLWDAESAESITSTLASYGFLDDYGAKAMRVREWGPNDVLAESV